MDGSLSEQYNGPEVDGCDDGSKTASDIKQDELFDLSSSHINFCGFNLREEGIIYILKEIERNGMKQNKTLLIIAFSLVVVLLVSCSAASSSPSFKAIASHGLEENEMG